jgi:hypothetical protein
LILYVADGQFYSLIADESSDISEKEQLSVSVRYLDLSEGKEVTIRNTFYAWCK